MDRDAAVQALEAVGHIEKLLDDCPHGAAKKIKDQLAVIEGFAHDAFPGGYDGECIYCEAPMGADESVHVGDEKSCNECWKKRVDEMQSCDHAFEDATDEHGEPGRQCHKCGYFQCAEAA